MIPAGNTACPISKQARLRLECAIFVACCVQGVTLRSPSPFHWADTPHETNNRIQKTETQCDRPRTLGGSANHVVSGCFHLCRTSLSVAGLHASGLRSGNQVVHRKGRSSILHQMQQALRPATVPLHASLVVPILLRASGTVTVQSRDTISTPDVAIRSNRAPDLLM